MPTIALTIGWRWAYAAAAGLALVAALTAISYAIEPKSKGDEEKIGEALHRLMEEDLALRSGRDPQTGEFLPEVIGNANASLAWSADGQYLFYLDKHPETLLAYRVMRHKLGTDAADDVLVYEEKDTAFYTGLWRSRSGDCASILSDASIIIRSCSGCRMVW